MANPAGRQPIGLEQSPGSGTRYPFVAPSEDILHLFGDLFVAFEDPHTEIVYPLRVAWLSGFGEDPAVNSRPIRASGWIPTPIHSHDIVILDANDMVMFDSTAALRFTSSSWDNRLLILEWTSAYAVCRCTKHTAWTQGDIDDGQTRTYAQYILPVNGELQADTWYRLPKRVRSLRVTSDPALIEHTSVVFAEGYNVALQHLPTDVPLTPILSFTTPTTTVVPGARKVNRINVSAVVGSGLGVFSDCEEAAQVIRTINNVPGDSHQNFNYDAEGCIRVQRPVSMTSLSPRQYTYAALTYSPNTAAALIKVSNDCTNCCSCTYFARTYQGLKRQWSLFSNIATVAESVRTLFHDNTQRWQVQKQIREADMLRVRLQVEADCKVAWGISICNASKCCIKNVKVHLTWRQMRNDVLYAAAIPPYACTPAKIEGSGYCDGPALAEVTWLTAHSLVTWASSDPQSLTTISGRHCFNGCRADLPGALKVQLHVAVTWESSEPSIVTGLSCVFPVLRATQGWNAPALVHAQKETPWTILNNINPFASI